MGLFNWLFNSGSSTSTQSSSGPSVNCDGTPMIENSMIDVTGKIYGDCGITDTCSNDMFDTSSSFDCFSSTDDIFSSIDDSFTSFDDF
ncbi:hypothetical protein [Thalassotalea sp. ND16A]|uniref:hypothetical protein n=1 Tax=Thalassotalea sp. ND16A TaxID=1535422 RepID=UPI000519EC10|nr:hypothetical protein [Thalassotalea sp. ND16A]KGJ92079.1 hypothetical protein ND16A_1773 [Thalassotalea sp. ND16A]